MPEHAPAAPYQWRNDPAIASLREAVARAADATEGNPYAVELWDALDDLCDALSAHPIPPHAD